MVNNIFCLAVVLSASQAFSQERAQFNLNGHSQGNVTTCKASVDQYLVFRHGPLSADQLVVSAQNSDRVPLCDGENCGPAEETFVVKHKDINGRWYMYRIESSGPDTAKRCQMKVYTPSPTRI